MPRLNSNLQSCVFFLYGEHPRTGKIDSPLGTGVFVGMSASNRDPAAQISRHIYAVTCKHLAPSGASIIRLNTKDGKSRFINLEPHDWEFIPDGSDIAALDITQRLSQDDEISFVPLTLFTTREFIKSKYLGIGEDGFMLGLFANHTSNNRNLIAGRFGNVSMLADDNSPIEQPNGAKRPAHIFDMRSRGGFSGSPVFVYRTPSGDLRNINNGPRIRSPMEMMERFGEPSLGDWENYWNARDNSFLMFFGIHVAQYSETAEARRAKPEIDDLIKHGDSLSLPSGMTVVVPAWEIIQLLELPVFTEQRKDRENDDKKTAIL